MILGIDEAGRGPCIGPMVMCGTIVDETNLEALDTLKKIGVKDSKKLSPEKRANINKVLKQRKLIVDYFVVKIPAYKIDEAVMREGDSLNVLEMRTQVKIITELSRKNRLDKVVIDCPSINTVSYKKALLELLKERPEEKNSKKTEIICEHRADENYIMVSAASIIAKVARDAEIEKLQRKYKKTEYGTLGSGYSSDVLTIEFLKHNFERLSGDKELFRKSWQTYKDVVKAKSQKKLGDF